MDCPNCGENDWDVYETDGDGMSNDYVEHVVCNTIDCGTECSIKYECKVLKITETS